MEQKLPISEFLIVLIAGVVGVVIVVVVVKFFVIPVWFFCRDRSFIKIVLLFLRRSAIVITEHFSGGWIKMTTISRNDILCITKKILRINFMRHSWLRFPIEAVEPEFDPLTKNSITWRKMTRTAVNIPIRIKDVRTIQIILFW